MENKEQNAFTGTVKYLLMLLPLLALIWHAALVSAKVQQNTDDIDKIKQNMETAIDRLTVQVADMNITVTRLETKVDMLRSESNR